METSFVHFLYLRPFSIENLIPKIGSKLIFLVYIIKLYTFTTAKLEIFILGIVKNSCKKLNQAKVLKVKLIPKSAVNK